MNRKPKVKWGGRALFHESAEALDVPTDQIMGAMWKDGVLTVLYNPGEYSLDAQVWTAFLERSSDDGVLLVREARPIGKTFGDMAREIGLPLPGDS